MADALRLAVTTFPQHWDGKGTITLNVLLIPAADPLPGSLIGPSSPSFANGAPTFTVIVNKGLSTLPASTGANVIARRFWTSLPPGLNSPLIARPSRCLTPPA